MSVALMGLAPSLAGPGNLQASFNLCNNDGVDGDDLCFVLLLTAEAAPNNTMPSEMLAVLVAPDPLINAILEHPSTDAPSDVRDRR